MINRVRNFALVILLLGPQLSFSQDSADKVKKENFGFFNFIEAKGHFGNFVRHTDSLDDVLKGNYYSGEVRVGFQSTGKADWQNLYKLPSYGFGFFHGNVNSPNEIGNPMAAFFFFNVPIVRGGKVDFTYDFSSGLAFNFREYDSAENPRNDVLGSKLNIYFNLGLVAFYHLSERMDLSLGFDFTHYSNGAIRTPNKGLNMYGLNVGVRYHLNPVKSFTRLSDPDFQPEIRPQYKIRKLPPHQRYLEFYTVVSGGLKTTSADLDDRDTYHPIFTWTIDGAYKYAHKGRIGVGFDYIYDGSMERWLNFIYPDSTHDWTDFSHVGVHIGHDLVVQKVSLVTQVGVYLYEGNEKGFVWARVGLRYDFSDWLFGRLALKTTEGFIADLTELGVGIRIKKNLRRPKDLN